MSAEWAPLVPLALIGTDRESSSSPPTWPGEVGQLASHLLQGDGRADGAATRVLRVAGVLATCGVAGAQGVEWTEPVPPAAQDEASPLADGAPIATLLTWALYHGPAHLHHLTCARLAQAGRVLPHLLLPQALDLGRRSTALRPLLAPVLGARGIWLARQRDDWAYAAGVAVESGDDARWSEGSIEQRVALLREERAADPAAMRARFGATLDDMPAKERATFAALLADGISIDDEPLVERLRADRSREVRQVALELLLRLPDAAHVQRAAARLAPLLRHERALVFKRWVIDAPAAAGDDWKEANLDATRPKHESLGERAWWLYQLVRQVPLPWWTHHTGMSPRDLLAWAGTTDWSEAIWRGWRDVVLAAPDSAWCDAFLDQWPAPLPTRDRDAVLSLLPPASRERHWLQSLQDDRQSVAAIIGQAIAVCPAGETLSLPLSSAFVERVRERMDRRQIDDYTLRTVLPDLCATVHPSVLDRIAAWPRGTNETPAALELMHAITQIIAVREVLRTITSPGRAP